MGTTHFHREVRMKVAINIQEFYDFNDTDVTKLMHRHFKNILYRFPIEDIKNEIYERLMLKKYIENYRPFKVYIDPKTNIWEFKTADAKFSTYIFTFMRNYILAYYGNKKPHESWLSLDEYNDSGYSGGGEKSLNFKDHKIVTLEDTEFQFDINGVLARLEKKTKNKGTLICSNKLEQSVAKCVERFGDEGCSEEDLYKLLFEKDSSNMEKLLFESLTKELVDKKVLRVEIKKLKKDEKEQEIKVYYLDDPIRRSLYKLFKYYMEGYKDKEISEKFNMTVAGVGALKRSLRKELQSLSKFEKKDKSPTG